MKNVSGQTPMFWAVRRGNLDVIKMLYGIGETFEGTACEFPGRGMRNLIQIAFYHRHNWVAEMIDAELYGELINGGRCVRPLRQLAKGVIRKQLASNGTDISKKVYCLGLPKVLGGYLVTLGWDLAGSK